jgi:signal transduction histidine kinase
VTAESHSGSHPESHSDSGRHAESQSHPNSQPGARGESQPGSHSGSGTGGSFRRRILLGTFLWSLGLTPILHVGFLWTHHQLRYELNPLSVGILLSLGVIFILTGIWQFRVALVPFARLREQLGRLKDGSNERIEGAYPTEVQPLVNDLNSLLEHRERIARRALAKAGDLAHGLKTPLAVLAQEAEQLEAAGQHESAATIGVQVERMRRQVDYQLTQARATSAGNVAGARCGVLASVEGLVRTLEKLYAGRALKIEVDVAAAHVVRGQREDLDEMLGNLLDNACKWAKSRVAIRSEQDGGMVVVNVDDDGPGLPVAMREEVMRRGVRADEAAPGSGLGLAIVGELAQLYEGTIALEDSPLGGLRAKLRLPA